MLCLQVILFRRVAGEVGDHRMGILEIEYLKNGVGGLAVLPFDNGILKAHLFGSHAVFKYGFAVQTNPGVRGAGNGNVNYPLSKANGLPASSTSYTHWALTYYLHRR